MLCLQDKLKIELLLSRCKIHL